jgi:hypothetical protein
MNSTPIACGICGFTLGAGLPGSDVWCGRCGRAVVARAAQQDWGGVVAGVAALVVGIVVVAALASLLKS